MNPSFNILVLSAGRRVELVKFIRETLFKHKIEGKIITCDMRPDAPAGFFSDDHIVVSPAGERSYIDDIIKVARDYKVSLIIPTVDPELLAIATNKDKITNATGALINIPELDSVRICRDKIETADFLKKNGVLTPETYMNRSEVVYPAFLKPEDGSSSINAHKVDSAEELDFYDKRIPNLMIQEYIDGNEYTLDIFCDFNFRPVTIVPRRRLRTRGGEIQHGYIEKNNGLISIGKKVAQLLKLVGHTTMQCIVRDSRIYVLEINPRFGGGAPISMKAGADSIINLYKIYNGHTLCYNEDYMSDIYCVRFDDAVFYDINGHQVYL